MAEGNGNGGPLTAKVLVMGLFSIVATLVIGIATSEMHRLDRVADRVNAIDRELAVIQFELMERGTR